MEHEIKGKRFGEILPVPQVEPVYPVSHMHINVVTLQVPPYSQSESETQAPIKNHFIIVKTYVMVCIEVLFKDNEDDDKENEQDDVDNFRDNSIDNDYDDDDDEDGDDE